MFTCPACSGDGSFAFGAGRIDCALCHGLGEVGVFELAMFHGEPLHEDEPVIIENDREIGYREILDFWGNP